jgi:hypothetical protein
MSTADDAMAEWLEQTGCASDVPKSTAEREELRVFCFPVVDIDGEKRATVDVTSSTPEVDAGLAALAQPPSSWQVDAVFVRHRDFGIGEPRGRRILRAAILKPRRPDDHATLPALSTSHYLYLPATYTLMSQLFNAGDAFIGLGAVCELGAGLGVCSCLLSQLDPPPSRLLATDGDARVMPLLRANLAANATPRCTPEAAVLRWGGELDAGLRGAFDVVVASDALFDCNVGRSATAECDSFFATAQALLANDGRIVLSVEPRDRLAGGSLQRRILAAAEAAGLACVERRERRLDGTVRPEWETDAYVFCRPRT